MFDVLDRLWCARSSVRMTLPVEGFSMECNLAGSMCPLVYPGSTIASQIVASTATIRNSMLLALSIRMFKFYLNNVAAFVELDNVDQWTPSGTDNLTIHVLERALDGNTALMYSSVSQEKAWFQVEFPRSYLVKGAVVSPRQTTTVERFHSLEVSWVPF